MMIITIYIYPSTEQNNIYYKNPLSEEIIAFIFPESDDIQKILNLFRKYN